MCSRAGYLLFCTFMEVTEAFSHIRGNASPKLFYVSSLISKSCGLWAARRPLNGGIYMKKPYIYQAPPPKNTKPISNKPLATKPRVKTIIKKSVMLVIFPQKPEKPFAFSIFQRLDALF